MFYQCHKAADTGLEGSDEPLVWSLPLPSLVTASFLPAYLQGHTVAGVDCFYRVPVTVERILHQLGIVFAVEGTQASS